MTDTTEIHELVEIDAIEPETFRALLARAASVVSDATLGLSIVVTNATGRPNEATSRVLVAGDTDAIACGLSSAVRTMKLHFAPEGQPS